MLYYLNYERGAGRKHLQWGNVSKVCWMASAFAERDGNFPRKFKVISPSLIKSGGSTPSATLPW